MWFVMTYPLLSNAFKKLQNAKALLFFLTLCIALSAVYSCVLALWYAFFRGPQPSRQKLRGVLMESMAHLVDVIRFSGAGLALAKIPNGEFFAMMCGLYVMDVTLRPLVNVIVYVVLTLTVDEDTAAKASGTNLGQLSELLHWQPLRPGGAASSAASAAAGGGGTRSEYASSAKTTSAKHRLTSLKPGSESAHRCKVVDEGPEFNRVAKGCLLQC